MIPAGPVDLQGGLHRALARANAIRVASAKSAHPGASLVEEVLDALFHTTSQRGRLDEPEGDGYARILVPVERESGVIAVANVYALRET